MVKMTWAKGRRGAVTIKLSCCHKADISTPGECRGRGPEATSYRKAMTQ